MGSYLGIPVAVIRFDLKTMGKLYEMLGELTGDKARAKELGDYCIKVVNEIGEAVAEIPEEKRVRVYYAEGEKGLQTDPKDSPHSEVLDLVGGINVADVAVQKGYGRSPVSLEQLLKWNPDRIIVVDGDRVWSLIQEGDQHQFFMGGLKWLKYVQKKLMHVNKN
jgi:iron complex transport system substrate-binding protein